MKANPEISSNLSNSIIKAINEYHSFEINNFEIITAEFVKDPYSVFTENSAWTIGITGRLHSSEDIRIIQDKPWKKIEYIYSAMSGLRRSHINVEHGVVLIAVMIRHANDFGEPLLQLGVGTLDSENNVAKFFSLNESNLHRQPDWGEDNIALTTFKNSQEIFYKNAWRYL